MGPSYLVGVWFETVYNLLYAGKFHIFYGPIGSWEKKILNNPTLLYLYDGSSPLEDSSIE